MLWIHFVMNEMVEVVGIFVIKNFKEFCCSQRVTAGAMSSFYGYAQGFGDFAQTVRGMPGNHIARGAHRAQVRHPKIVPQGAKFTAQHAVVESHVVGHKDSTLTEVQDVSGNFVKFGSLLDHGIGNAGEAHDEIGDGLLRIDQRDIGIRDGCSVVLV